MHARRPVQSIPPDAIETTSTGGGASARVAVLGAVLVLAAVVWLGVSAKRPQPPDAPVRPTAAVAAAATSVVPLATDVAALPLPRPSVHARSPRATPNPDELRGIFQMGEDAFAVIASIDDRMYLQVLDEVEPGLLHGAFRIPFPSGGAGHSIRFAQLWTRDPLSRRSFVPLREWDLRLDGLTPDREPATAVVQDFAEPQPQRRRAPRAARLGYSIVIKAETRGDYGVVIVDVELGSIAKSP